MTELGFIVPDHHTIPRDIADSSPLDRLIHIEGGAVKILEMIHHCYHRSVGGGLKK